MKEFKFFQKERKSFFNRMSEQLQTPTDRIRPTYGIRVPNDEIRTPIWDEIDNQVIQMVNEYYTILPNTYKQTETLWMEITSVDVSHSFNNIHTTIIISVYMRNQPHSRIEYTLIRNGIGSIRILEKRGYNESF